MQGLVDQDKESEFIPCDGNPLEILSGNSDLVLKLLNSFSNSTYDWNHRAFVFL